MEKGEEEVVVDQEVEALSVSVACTPFPPTPTCTDPVVNANDGSDSNPVGT